jgi:phosphoribosylamine--glycine ligase
VKVLVLGSGGREHALCIALSRDPAVSGIVCAPGNPGMAALGECLPVDLGSAEDLVRVAVEVGPDLVVVGPEGPLVAGVADMLRDKDFSVFGPSAAAAQLEGSKAFAKQVMSDAGVPTAASEHHASLPAALDALDRFGAGVPWVIKHDGLAAGKGVVVTTSRTEAEAHVRAMGPDGVVLEDFLDGPEVSLFAIVDAAGGVHPLIPAQDHKRVGDGDTGPNTGGMGAYAPLPWAPPDLVEQVRSLVLEPTVAQLARRGTPFQGLLYAGLALTSRGLRVVEFNARFGDPETQGVLALLDAPLTGVLSGAVEPTWRAGSAVTVVLAAQGYPAAPVLGAPLGGLEAAGRIASVTHAGTRVRDGAVVSSGGRVLAVTAVGASLAEARGVAYESVACLSLEGSHFRSDIGLAAVEGRIQLPLPQK